MAAKSVVKVVSFQGYANIFVAQKGHNGCGWRPVHSCVVDEEKILSSAPRGTPFAYKLFYRLRFNTKEVRLKNWDARERVFLG